MRLIQSFGEIITVAEKILIACYSRTGTTRKVAGELAKILKADVEEIIDTKNRSGALGYILAGRDAMSGKLTVIKPAQKNPRDYALVVVGTPVWAWTAAPAARTYILQNKAALKKVAFFCTRGGDGSARALKALEDACGRKPVAVLALKTSEITGGSYVEQVKEFARKLGKALRKAA